jgi:hypothetical protein
MARSNQSCKHGERDAKKPQTCKVKKEYQSKSVGITSQRLFGCDIRHAIDSKDQTRLRDLFLYAQMMKKAK